MVLRVDKYHHFHFSHALSLRTFTSHLLLPNSQTHTDNMTEEAPPDVKRRRLSTDDTTPQGIRSITDLPTGILAHAASFLAAPSKALFAVALALDEDENSVSLPNEMSSAIVGNQWDTLDFGQIEEKLARKLSDAEVEKVLLCIDAVNNLKRLKLTKCQSITGTCLEPLRGSLIIEQIDLDTDCSPICIELWS
jgi:hypothetical protein